MLIEKIEKKFPDILPDALIVINNDGEIFWCNTAAEKFLKLNRNEIKDHSIKHIIHFPDFDSFLHQTPYQTKESFLLSNTKIHLSVTLIHKEHGQILLLLRDITHIHYLEKMRQDFVANVSHELRTPLTVIHGYLEILLEDKNDNSNLKKIFGEMYQQTLRMEKLVEDLLFLARLENQQEETQSKKPISVNKLLKTICADAKILSGGASHYITLHCQNIQLIGNETELYGAFSNIIFNAIRYTPAKGAIHVEWKEEKNEGVLSVKDSGIGIAPEHLLRLTERFYRVDNARSSQNGGTGLGLAIVKHVLIRHDARLEIESQLGAGSVFRCYFPQFRIIAAPDNIELMIAASKSH